MADNYTARDSANNPIIFKTKDVGGGIQSTQIILSDVFGTPYDATNKFVVDGSNVTQPISALSLPLPAGAATSALQTTQITSLNQLHVDLTTGTIGIAATALPLPAGAATSALQTTQITSLAQLHNDLTGTINVAAASLPLPSGAALDATLQSLLSLLQPCTIAAIITPGTPVTAGKQVAINCTVAGTLRLKMAGGTTVDLQLSVGQALIPNISVIDVVAANTTATVTVTVLR